MRTTVWKLTQTTTGSADVPVSAEDAAEVTNDAIESVQSITSLLHLPTWVGRTIFIVLVVLIMLWLVKMINKAFRRTMNAMQENKQDTTLLSFARYVVLAILYFAGGVIVVSSIPGATDSLNALLASGGIVAVVLGFASQDALSNVAGGIMILTFKPFVIGDFVRYIDMGVSGTVEDISLRHTTIRTPENKRLIVPNGKINEGVIENANYADSRVCEFFNVSITYESDLEHAIHILREEVMKQPLHLDVRDPKTQAHDPEVQVEVLELADSAVVLRAWLWASDLNNAMKLKFLLNRSVKTRFDAEGIEFAYPHITIKK